MNSYSLHTPEKVAASLAERLRELRLASGLKQATLAERAGISLGSLRRFEQSGQASFELVLRLAWALGRLDDFADLLSASQPQSLAQLEALYSQGPKRGRI